MKLGPKQCPLRGLESLTLRRVRVLTIGALLLVIDICYSLPSWCALILKSSERHKPQFINASLPPARIVFIRLYKEANIPVRDVNADLLSWDDLRDRYSWKGLLIGNGASRAVWDEFKYPSLYETANSTDLDHPLLSEDQHIFEELGTTNFEQVLATLATSKMICDVLGLDVTPIQERYESIQRALFEPVSMVHLRWREWSSGRPGAASHPSLDKGT